MGPEPTTEGERTMTRAHDLNRKLPNGIMASDTHDISRDRFMLKGRLAEHGYDWWWHSFTAHHAATGRERSFFIEYFCCNPALAQGEPVFGQLPANRAMGIKPSYIMIKAGCWGEGARQLHRFLPWHEVEIGDEGSFFLHAGDCLASESDLIGSVEVTPEDAHDHPEWMSDAGSMFWDLRAHKDIAFNVGLGASDPARRMKAFDMFWHAEGIKTRYEGTVMLDGEMYKVSPGSCYGYADKNWGRSFTSLWFWLSSCDLVSRRTGRRLSRSAFDIGGGCPRIAGIPLGRKLLGCINHEGTSYDFNFSKPWLHAHSRFACWETDGTVEWRAKLWSRTARLEVTVSCRKDEMLLIDYEEPDGSRRHTRLWNGGTGTGQVVLSKKLGNLWTLVDKIDAAHIGCEYGEYDATGPYRKDAKHSARWPE